MYTIPFLRVVPQGGRPGNFRIVGRSLAGPARYGLAVLFVALATLLRLLLPGVLEDTPYLAFYPAIVAAAAFGGFGPGIMATLLAGLIVNIWFVEPVGQITLTPVEAARLTVLFIGGLGISAVAGAKRALKRRANQQFDMLAHLAAIVENSEDAILSETLDGTIQSWNAAAERMFGYRPDEIIGQSVLRLIPPERAHEESQIIQQLRTGEPVTHLETVRIAKDGRRIDIAITVSPLKDARGKIIGGSKILRDITERKRLETQARLQIAALETAANGIAITDADGAVLWINNALSELTGYAREEMIGTNFRLLNSGQQDQPFYHDLWSTIRRGEVWHGELINRRKDGTLYAEEQTISPLHNGGGAIINFIAVKQDISARRAQQEALLAARVSAEKAKAAAEDANKAKDRFLAVLSHELRTPLTPVVTSLAMLQRQTDLDEFTRESLEIIRRNVELEVRLIDDLLDVTRIARGKIELYRKPVLLCEVLRRAVEVVQPDIEARRLHFGLDAPDLPYIVYADATRLQQVFWNLLRNAIKFTPQDGCVGIRCRKDPDNHITVEVLDSGDGIHPEALTRIFNAFEQAERSITRQFGGLGLGLAISKALVELHGGTIAAHSDGKGKGATFRVRLPIAAEKPRAEPPTAAPVPPARSLRILLVEDHGDTARVMVQLLTLEGHHVERAGDVAAALHMLRHHSFDLLISDLGLPDRSGLDLLHELRRDGSTIPAIALSGYGHEEDLLRSKAAGFAIHLTKPTRPERLAEAIATVMA